MKFLVQSPPRYVFPFAIGILLSLVACKPSAPNVHFPSQTDTARQADCPVAIPQNFQFALQEMDLPAMEAAARNGTERQVAAQARAITLGKDFPTKPFNTTAQDSLLYTQWTSLEIAKAWEDGDHKRILKIGDNLGAAKIDPSTMDLSMAYASDLRQERTEFSQPQFTIPLHLNSTNNPLIDVRINGHTYRFWLDTGAGITVISSAVAKAAGIRSLKDGDFNVNTSTKHIVQTQAAYIDSLSFGEFTAYNHSCGIMDKKDLTFRLLGIPLVKIDGIIGWPLLQALDLEFNFPEEHLTVRKPAPRIVEQNLAWLWQPYLRIQSASGCLMNLMLDTGSANTFFHHSSYEKLEQKPSRTGKAIRGGAGGNEMLAYDQLDTCRFFVGPHETVIDYAEGYPLKKAADDIVVFDGVIGQDVLAKGIFRIDYQNRSYSFTPQK